MQHEFQLTLTHVFDRLESMHGSAEAVSVGEGGVRRSSYAEVARRVRRLAAALSAFGIRPGDRVATLAENSQEHLELYLGVPCMGAVLHTLNLRFSPQQLEWVVNHASDRVVFVDASLVPVLAELAPALPTVEHYVVIGRGPDPVPAGWVHYDDLIEAAEEDLVWPALDDRSAAMLCYTSGTTGDPKGVLYSHRAIVLDAIVECAADMFGVSQSDRILLVPPMFHANGWGLPYSAALTGASLVLPGRTMVRPEVLCETIEAERITLAGAVPTVWGDLLRHADEHGADLSSLRLAICGGSAPSRALIEAFEDRYGVTMVQGWGMTETGPMASLARPPEDLPEEEAWSRRLMVGPPAPLVEARIVDESGKEQEWGTGESGELQVRGPFIASAYFGVERAEDRFDGPWLRTGDVAEIDSAGWIRITDRAKDVIKSGGEWISSLDLENALMAHPAIAEAAVVARPDERWSERPVAFLIASGQPIGDEDLTHHLRDLVPKWWIPDEVNWVDELPRTGVGKIDKRALRDRVAGTGTNGSMGGHGRES
jgi:fatty-acyl-CoA synthase